MRYRVKWAAYASLALAAVAGCGDTSGPSTNDTLYQANLEKWNTTGPASYEMVIGRTCACPLTGPVRLVVRNRVVESRTYVDSGQPVPPDQAAGFPDVPALFELVRSALTEDYYRFTVTYNATYGYPGTLLLDRVGSTLDDNVNYQVLDLQPLTP